MKITSLKTSSLVIFSLILSMGLSSCAPYAANSDSSPEGLESQFTGAQIQITPPYQQNKKQTPELTPASTTPSPSKVKVNYVSSVSPKVYENILTALDTLSPQGQKTSKLKLVNHIRGSKITFFADQHFKTPVSSPQNAQFIELILLISDQYHAFRSRIDNFKNIQGKKSLNSNPYSSNLQEDSSFYSYLDCLDVNNCTDINISVSQGPKKENGPVAFLGYSHRPVQIVLRSNKEQKGEISSLEFVQNLFKSQEQNPFTASSQSWTIGQGYSTTKIYQKDVLSIFTPVTNSKASSAALNTKQVSIPKMKIHKGAYLGTTNGSSFLFEMEISPLSELSKAYKIQIKVLSSQDFQKEVAEQERAKDLQEKVNSDNASWADVGVNPETSLFHTSFPDEINATVKKDILKMEADLEFYRQHSALLKYSQTERHQSDLKTFCTQFIENMAPAREIIANIYLRTGVTPSFAALMWLETSYGKNDYTVSIYKKCGSASGPFQITDATAQFIKTLSQPLIDKLKENGFEYNIYNAKLHFPNSKFSQSKNRSSAEHEALCAVENPQMRALESDGDLMSQESGDDRMYLETSTMLSASYLKYIYNKKSFSDAALSFTAYNLGPGWSPTQNHKESIPFTLRDIINFNLSNVQQQQILGTNLGFSIKNDLSKKQIKEYSGVSYAIRALALRHAMTQPEVACSKYLQEQDILNIYKDAKKLIKQKVHQIEMNLFRTTGPVLNSSSEYIH